MTTAATPPLFDTLFAGSNLLVAPFWLAMMLAPRWRGTRWLLASPAVVLAPALLYLALVVPRLAEILPAVARPELPTIATLLGTPAGATIAWAHFLAFDLFVGRWIYLDARERGLSAWLVSPVLLITLLLGPLGLLTYLALRGLLRSDRARTVVSRVAGSTPSVAGLRLLAGASTLLLLAALVLMGLDQRQVLGASTWLKPLKFAISVTTTSLTLALLLRAVPLAGRGVRRAIALFIGTMVVELTLITIQSARGVPSHFNAATPVDTAVFAVMGLAIAVSTAALGFLAWRSFRTPAADGRSPALVWGVRLGLVVMLIGAGLGGLMPGPTAAQRAALAAGQTTPLIGGHAVGVADGGAGMPITRWSTEGGDLRVPHFVGLHGLQVLPLVGWWLGRRRFARRSPAGPVRAARLTVVAGGGYLGLVAVSLVQALRGQPLLAPDALTWLLLATVLAATGAAAGLGWRLAPGHSARSHSGSAGPSVAGAGGTDAVAVVGG